ncbi:MAG: hypothetical protein ACRET0_00325 [Steroidobacteraceae bacterium]
MRHLRETKQSATEGFDGGQARNWGRCKEGKQAEFLLETNFPWQLVEQAAIHAATDRRRNGDVVERGMDDIPGPCDSLIGGM